MISGALNTADVVYFNTADNTITIDKLIFKESGSKYLCYADDLVMFADTFENCEKMLDIAVNYLESEIMLTLSKEKKIILY